MRAMSLNLFGHDADWPARREVLAAGLRRLRPDVLVLQEAIVDATYDQAADLLGEEYHLAHQTLGLVSDGRHRGASVASRWPILEVHEVDLHPGPLRRPRPDAARRRLPARLRRARRRGHGQRPLRRAGRPGRLRSLL
jgi:endonuclease/exonuclease/phosphatase family metal-dependent hydrolase